MNQEQYNGFKTLRQNYYVAGRCLLINQLFGAAGINLGYSIELSLKFLLALKGHPQSQLMQHHIAKYYRQVVERGYISALCVSDDLLDFMDDRLNARYPTIITTQIAEHESKQEAYVFPIDMIHCYDDFILQLDDAISRAVGDPRFSIGFRACRDINSVKGRIFFHCNDHAFQRIPHYRRLLGENRNEGDNFEQIDSILTKPSQLWNFKGLMAFRSWGPKSDWSPAKSFTKPRIDDNSHSLRAAMWSANNADIDISISSMEIVLPKGEYEFECKKVVIPSRDKANGGGEAS